MARPDVRWALVWLLGVTAGQAAPSWGNILRQEPAWYATAEARAVADSVRLYQTESGGWPKNTDMSRPPSEAFLADQAFDRRAPTIDNGATTTPLRLLARVHAANPRPGDRAALERGLDYLLAAQLENGGWAQYYPSRRGYYTHVTFNDDAMVNVLNVLRAVARGEEPWSAIDEGRRARAAAAVDRGIACILAAQVRVDGQLTAWCAQHDEVTLAPAPARKFEPVSLSGAESVGIVRFLMGIEQPSAEVEAAIRAAVRWLEQVAIPGRRVERVKDAAGKYVDQVLIEDPASDVWARFYEIGTNRPIFVGRDEVVRYDLAEVEAERRGGYAYYGTWATKLLRDEFPAWRRRVAVESGDPVFFIAGDSTAADKPRATYPERGWGQLFRELVSRPWRVDNRALNGRSTKSFRAEGHWDRLLADLSPGDIVLIQFGHNDEKVDRSDVGAPAQTDYRANLIRFIAEVRERGGEPWLATSVARRRWNEAGDAMVPTHGEYPTVVREVAAAERVPLLDLEPLTTTLETAAGVEGSKALHLWFAPGESPTAPEGLQDDTHYSAAGARQVAELVADEIVRQDLPLAFYLHTDAVVATDGSGDFASIEKAIYAAPHRTEADPRWVIRVKPGVYQERVYVQRERGRIAVVGEDVATTVLDAAVFADQLGPDGVKLGTFRTPTLQIDGDGFVVENLTIQNSAGPVGQALALRVDGDRVVLRRCRLLGWQDTVLVNRGRHYFEDCRIEGHVDFIFGGATAWFERCAIFARGDGYVTAASTPVDQPYGLVFSGGRVTGAEGVRTYLGRPWRDHAMTVFMRTELGEAVRAEGWHNWNKSHAEATVRYAEYHNTGPGATTAERPAWVRQLSAEEAETLTIETVLGPDRWW